MATSSHKAHVQDGRRDSVSSDDQDVLYVEPSRYAGGYVLGTPEWPASPRQRAPFVAFSVSDSDDIKGLVLTGTSIDSAGPLEFSGALYSNESQVALPLRTTEGAEYGSIQIDFAPHGAKPGTVEVVVMETGFNIAWPQRVRKVQFVKLGANASTIKVRALLLTSSNVDDLWTCQFKTLDMGKPDKDRELVINGQGDFKPSSLKAGEVLSCRLNARLAPTASKGLYATKALDIDIYKPVNVLAHAISFHQDESRSFFWKDVTDGKTHLLLMSHGEKQAFILYGVIQQDAGAP